MPHWKYELKLDDLYKKFNDDEIDIQGLAKQTMGRLALLPFREDDTFDMVLQLFKGVETVDMFDEALSLLYDFGDQDQRLWIKTH